MNAQQESVALIISNPFGKKLVELAEIILNQKIFKALLSKVIAIIYLCIAQPFPKR